ncbi:hypothetical protein [Halonotius sp. GCM10025705]|uniref:hypothetical protein n=1 Tax=Halonotius sp. GCM10025705 TaxID=3252678 RepID=UPI003613F8B1
MLDIRQKLKQLRWKIRSYLTNSSDIEAVPVGDLFSPPDVKERGSDWERRGDYFRRTLVVTDLPDVVEPPWFSRIQYKLPPRVIASTAPIEPYDNVGIQEDLVERSSHLLSHENTLRHHNLRERFETESLTKSTLEISKQNLNKSYFKLSLYFEIRGATKYGLDAATDYVYSIAESENFEVTSIKHRHTESFNTASPIGTDEINYDIIVDSEILSAVALPIPYSPVTLNEDE